MSTRNANIFVAIPLFRRSSSEELKFDNYQISVFASDRPVAYVIDVGEAAQLMNAEFVEKEFICLGDL
jgi:hypothetical protein